jgi:geranylgeranyl pyrophosphate synthase
MNAIRRHDDMRRVERQDMRIKKMAAPELPGEVVKCLGAAMAIMDGLKPEEFVDRRLYASSTHLLSRRGKLLRPTLVFLGAAALGARPRDYVDLAAAMELFHVSSLIHDDLIDRDARRRNTSSVHARYGNDAAILAGDALISKAIMLSSRYGPEVMSESARASMDMCAGEMLDIACRKGGAPPSLSAYLRAASLKSASLIGVASSIVAVHRNHVLAGRMRAFGEAAGIAFQIRDDVLELVDRKYGGDASGTAKQSGGRTNLVVVLERRYSLNREKALRRAISLNNRYLDRAVGEVRGCEASLLGSCAESIRLIEE